MSFPSMNSYIYGVNVCALINLLFDEQNSFSLSTTVVFIEMTNVEGTFLLYSTLLELARAVVVVVRRFG